MSGSSIAWTVAFVCALSGGARPAFGQRDDPRWAHEVFMRVPLAGEPVMPPAAAPGTPAQAVWKYRFTAPGPNWKNQTYNDNAWSSGQAGFEQWGSTDPLDAPSTVWPSDKPELWLRRKVTLTAADLEPNALALWGRWDDKIEVFINGVPAFSQDGWTPMYRWGRILPEAQAALVVGTNTIAVKMLDYGGGRYFDLGLIRNPLKSLPGAGANQSAGGWRFEAAARQYFQDRLIPAGTIAVIKDERIVSSWSFGYQDKNITVPLPHGAVFRLASLDKTPGFAAMRNLIRAGYVEPGTGTPLTLDTLVFPLLNQLGYTALPGVTPDPRINQITLGMLIDHTSGIGGLGWTADMAAAFGVGENDLTAEHNIRWLAGAPLAADPGTGGYSSDGAMVVRFMVDLFTGGIENYLHATVNAWLDAPDIYIAAERLADRRPNEPWYQTHGEPIARWVYLENYFALAASADSYVNFMKGWDLWNAQPLINPVTGAYEPPNNGASVFYGGMSGTRTAAVQRRWDRVSWAIFVNCDEDVGALSDEFWGIVDTMAPWEWFCTADVDADGFVNGDDFDAFVDSFVLGDPVADVNHDAFVSGDDFDVFVERFAAGC